MEWADEEEEGQEAGERMGGTEWDRDQQPGFSHGCNGSLASRTWWEREWTNRGEVDALAYGRADGRGGAGSRRADGWAPNGAGISCRGVFSQLQRFLAPPDVVGA